MSLMTSEQDILVLLLFKQVRVMKMNYIITFKIGLVNPFFFLYVY